MIEVHAAVWFLFGFGFAWLTVAWTIGWIYHDDRTRDEP